MLSILIPIYNWNCLPLVEELRRQAQPLNVAYEIICLDDASTCCREGNRAIALMPDCRYDELPQNIGRSRIRNRLGMEAQYDYLLFLDCDARLVHENFLKRYLAYANLDRVIVGGVAYGEKPLSRDYLLRYRYGKRREEIAVQERRKKPYMCFSSFNFLIPKRVLLTIGFDESLARYGYEDTLLGRELEKQGVEVIHMDAPAYHTGIDTNSHFLRKSKQAVNNLIRIEQKMGRSEAARFFKLTRLSLRLKGLLPILAFLFSVVQNFLKYLITRFFPVVFLLDIYKLGCYAVRKSEKSPMDD